jgi:hypothetical protein
MRPAAAPPAPPGSPIGSRGRLPDPGGCSPDPAGGPLDP